MPRYFFDLLDDDGLSIDDRGLELLTLRAVQAEAAKALADAARDAMYVSDRSSKRFMSIEVRDEAGAIMQVRFAFAGEELKP